MSYRPHLDKNVSGAVTKDDIETDSIPFLLVCLSKIADDSGHHNATKARKLRDELRDAQVLVWKKQVKKFLKQNGLTLS
jgi:hypothetical protein